MAEEQKETGIITQKENKNIELNVDFLFDNFAKHLNILGNSRILFSGRFGVGKTYFLNKFFENKEEYNVFHLYPVNYQVNNNEDVFELLKYDILVKLTEKNPEIFKENKIEDFVDLRNLLYVWGEDNLQEIVKTMLFNIPKLGKPLKDTSLLIDKFLEFKKVIEGDEKLKVETFLKNTNKKIKETDVISELIKSKINKNKDRKSVLILDDLDRLDPEHIFRLLNIFSAFFEHNKIDNKFGFDKIILVADYKNLKSIFHHKYGENTESGGYFDKFFSVSIYDFSIKEIINKHVDYIIENIQNENEQLREALSSKGSGYVGIFIKEILLKASNYKLLNMREVLKPVKFQFNSLAKGVYVKNSFADSRSQFIDISINLLIDVFSGDKNILLEKLKEIKKEVVKKSFSKNFHFEAFIPTLFRDVVGKTNKNSQETDRIVSYGNGEYKIKNVNSSGNLEIVEGRLDKLFYDLLIKYIESDKYIKNNHWDYEK